jgi:hypothetical protein
MDVLGLLAATCWFPQGTLAQGTVFKGHWLRQLAALRVIGCSQNRTAAIRKNCCGPRLKGVHYEDIYSSGVI